MSRHKTDLIALAEIVNPAGASAIRELSALYGPIMQAAVSLDCAAEWILEDPCDAADAALIAARAEFAVAYARFEDFANVERDREACAMADAATDEGAAMLYVQQIVLGNPGRSPDEHARWLKDAIAGAAPGSPLAPIGETLTRIGVETAIEEVILQEAQSIQFTNEDCLPDEPVTARILREVTGSAPPLRSV